MSEFTAKLLRKAAAGDQDAITELYELTYSSVYKTVKSMVADEDTVLDIVQDSYIKGFQSLHQLDAPENFRAWMKRIATNKAKDYLKKKKPILFTDMASEDGEEIDFRDDCLDHCPEEVLDRKETTRLMNEILATLSEDQRLVIGMFYYEEMSVREIAEILGCSENTVKSRLNYGRKKVEVKVRELEKKGTKLYSLAPLPFLLWLLRMDTQAAELPSAAVLEAVTAECAATGAAAGSAGTAAAATAGAKAAAGAGIKALSTKIIAGILAVSVAGGGTMLALSANDREKPEPTQQIVATEAISDTSAPTVEETAPPTTMEETIPAVTAEEAYQGITAQYSAVLGIDSSVFLEAPYDYFNGDHAAICYYHMYHDGSFYYSHYDIDGNGVAELLIGTGSEDNIRVVDIYGFSGEMAVQLVDEPTLGDRSQLTVMEDGSLYLFGSGGAAAGIHILWRIGNDGCSLDTVFEYQYDFMNGYDGIYHGSDGSTVTDTDFYQMLETYTEVTGFPWVAMEVTQPDQSADAGMDLSGLTGWYESLLDGSGIGIFITQKDANTLIAKFSTAFSNEEPQYEVTYEEGFWSLRTGDSLMFFDFTIREGYLLVEGSAPPELEFYLGAFKKT